MFRIYPALAFKFDPPHIIFLVECCIKIVKQKNTSKKKLVRGYVSNHSMNHRKLFRHPLSPKGVLLILRATSSHLNNMFILAIYIIARNNYPRSSHLNNVFIHEKKSSEKQQNRSKHLEAAIVKEEFKSQFFKEFCI